MAGSASAARAWCRSHRADLAVAAAITIVAAAYHLAAGRLLPAREDLQLFGADTARAARHMAVRGPMLDRSQFHPLFPLLAQSPTRVLAALGVERLASIRLAIASWAGLGSAALYGLARARSWARAHAIGLGMLAAVSGGWTFFGAIPETYAVGATAVAIALALVGRRSRPSWPTAALGLVLSASGTLTGLVGPAVAWWRAERAWRRRCVAVVAALAAAAGALAVQRLLFGTRLLLTVSGEGAFVRHDLVAGAAQSLRTLLVDVWATPPPSLRSGVVTFSRSGLLDGGPGWWAPAAIVAAWWVVTVRAAWRQRRDPLVQGCLAGLVLQVALALAYGDEPFLFSALLVPLAVTLVIAGGGPAPHRRRVAVLCWALVPALAAVNLVHLADAGRLL
jgi:hypothetical protein